MRYYIIKQKSASADPALLRGIREIDKAAEFVDGLDDCDIAVLQRGWIRSRAALAERNRAVFELGKYCRESYLYTDRYAAKLN